MKKLVFALVAGAAALGAGGSAEAASCITKYYTGVWVGAPVGEDSDSYCLVQFGTKGQIIQASCFDDKTLVSDGTMKGKFKVNKACEATGDFTVIPNKGARQQVTFTGTMDPVKGTLKGKVKSKGQEAIKYQFVEQWN